MPFSSGYYSLCVITTAAALSYAAIVTAAAPHYGQGVRLPLRQIFSLRPPPCRYMKISPLSKAADAFAAAAEGDIIALAGRVAWVLSARLHFSCQNNAHGWLTKFIFL